VRIEPDDVSRFSAASFDRNPLHVSADYARRTPYGEPVIFGVLGLLAALGLTSPRPGYALRRLSADFQGPLFVGVEYALELKEDSPSRVSAALYDGRELITSFTATFEPGALPPGPARTPAEPAQAQPARLDSTTIAGASAAGAYYPAPELVPLAQHYGLAERGLTAEQVASLLWSSYLIGMQLPGERALFSRLTITFAETPPAPGTVPLEYQASVATFDERFNLARIGARLSLDGSLFAEAELRAFVREDVPRTGFADLERLLPPSRTLAGRVALVTGASRGLGATIARGLASQGCTVLANFLRSRDEVERIAAELAQQDAGPLIGIQGDAADPAWCEQARLQLERDYGGLDILVCNAALPLRPMALHPSFAARLAAYVADSVALASTPLASLLDQVALRAGWTVVISSAAVADPPADWPHYVSAKSAIEALARVAALQQPDVGFLIVRPPRLLTDLTNTPSPLSRADVLAPEVVAARIVQRLLEPSSGGTVELLDEFA
jgi:NAD(P)-dependent dehydrogenase (short-subunit alcohol dehydrogenase family)